MVGATANGGVVRRLMTVRHGPISPCVIAHSERVVLEYLAADEDSEERYFIEQRYGKNNITRLVLRYQDEMANKEWLDRSTTECPGCTCRVEKNLGCNHVGLFPSHSVSVAHITS